jgi:hypothetical protein
MEYGYYVQYTHSQWRKWVTGLRTLAKRLMEKVGQKKRVFLGKCEGRAEKSPRICEIERAASWEIKFPRKRILLRAIFENIFEMPIAQLQIPNRTYSSRSA